MQEVGSTDDRYLSAFAVMLRSSAKRVHLPKYPQATAGVEFPYLATIAPVFIGILIFLILKSPFVLLFAFLTPLMFVFHYIDKRIMSKRKSKKEIANFWREFSAVKKQGYRLFEEYILHLKLKTPLSYDIVRGVKANDMGYTLGYTPTRALGFDGDTNLPDEVQRFCKSLSVAQCSPAVFEFMNVYIVGWSACVVSCVRSILVQIISRNISRKIFICGESKEEVVRALGAQLDLSACFANAQEVDAARIHVRCIDSVDNVNLETIEKAEPGYDIYLLCYGAGCAVFQKNSLQWIRPEYLSSVSFMRWYQGLAKRQERGKQTERVMDFIPVEEVDTRVAEIIKGTKEGLNRYQFSPVREKEGKATVQREMTGSARFDLRAQFCAGRDGLFEIDLVRDGPHAAIGGTTGSGKSEFLISWLLSMAVRYSARECRFLCLDFKGGATFDSVAGLPHCLGVVTDLDGTDAKRMVQSLLAEMRKREAFLREKGVRDISKLEHIDAVPRLVIFVDEFQVLVQDYAELYSIFADIAARGRSLGIHLILCSQRPAFAFGEALLANILIRICLRVALEGDFRALFGAVAGINAFSFIPGRAAVSFGGAGARSTVVQAGICSTDLLSKAIDFCRDIDRDVIDSKSIRIWHPRLRYPLIDGEAVERGFWAVEDSPKHQLQQGLEVVPPGENTLILGGSGSGKTQILQAMAHAAIAQKREVIWLPGDIAIVWDFLSSFSRLENSRLFIICDDFDLLEMLLEQEVRQEFLDLFHKVVSTNKGVSWAVSSTKTGGAILRFQSTCKGVLRLPFASKHEWIVSGGGDVEFENLSPGCGYLQNKYVQGFLCSGKSLFCKAGFKIRTIDSLQLPFGIVSSNIINFKMQYRKNNGSIFGDANMWKEPASTLQSVPFPAPFPASLSPFPALQVDTPHASATFASQSDGEVRGMDTSLSNGCVYAGNVFTWQKEFSFWQSFSDTHSVLLDNLSGSQSRQLLGRSLPPASMQYPSLFIREPDGRIQRAVILDGFQLGVVEEIDYKGEV